MAKEGTSNGTSAEKFADEVKEQVENIGGDLFDFAEKARNDIVKRMKSAAQGIRKQVENSEEEVKTNAEKVAKKLEDSAEYLNNLTAEKAEQVTEQVENSGWKGLLVMFLLGVMIGWMLSKMGD